MPRIITPFATGSVLSPEQGGTGLDDNGLLAGQVLGAAGPDDSTPIEVGPVTLLGGAGIIIDATVPGEITFVAAGSGGINAAIQTVLADYVALDTDYTILVDATAGNVNITVPQTNGNVWNVKKIDASANTVTITPASGVIDGAAGIVTAVRWTSYTVQSDGVNLYIL